MVTAEPKSKEWLLAHNGTIGSSRAAAVLGRSKYETPLDVYREMIDPDPKPKPITGRMRHGMILEPWGLIVAEEQFDIAYVKVNGDRLDSMRRHPDLPFAHTTPDAVTMDGDEPIEVKTPDPAIVSKVRLRGLKACEAYEIQCRHHMAVMDRDRCFLVLIHPVDLSVYVHEIHRDRETEQRIIEGEQCFWERLQRREPPEPAAEPEPLKLPDDGGELLVIDNDEALAAAEAWIEAQAAIEDAQDLKEEAKGRLLDVAAGAPVFEIHGGGEPLMRVYHKTQQGRETVDRKALLADHPEMAKYVKRGRPFKRLRTYILTS